MPPLSSLLLQREIATLREVDQALARQATHGGDLVTNLIEVARIDERKLLEVIGEYEDIEPLLPGPIAAPSEEALSTVPRDLALRHSLLPLRLDEKTLDIAVAERLPPGVDEDLGFSLGLVVRQKITTLARIREGIARAFSVPLESRFQQVVAQLDGSAQPTVSEPPRDSLLPSVAPGTRVPGVDEVATPRSSPPGPRTSTIDREAALRIGRPRPIRTSKSSGRRRGPFTLTQAGDALSEAKTNGAVLRALFDFARQYFEYTAVFVVRGDLAEGFEAAGPGTDRAKIRGIGVPLEIPSVLSAARELGSHILRLPTDEGIDAVIRKDLQRAMTAPVLILPVPVRQRVVALMYGDDGQAPVDLDLVGDVIAFVPLVSAAIENLIVRKKFERTSVPPEDKDKEPEKPSDRHDTLRGLAAVGAPDGKSDGSKAAPVAAPMISPAAETLPQSPPRKITEPFVEVVDEERKRETAPGSFGVSSAATSVPPSASEPADSCEGRDSDVSSAAASVRAGSVVIDEPRPDTVVVAKVIAVGTRERKSSAEEEDDLPWQAPASGEHEVLTHKAGQGWQPDPSHEHDGISDDEEEPWQGPSTGEHRLPGDPERASAAQPREAETTSEPDVPEPVSNGAEASPNGHSATQAVSAQDPDSDDLDDEDRDTEEENESDESATDDESVADEGESEAGAEAADGDSREQEVKTGDAPRVSFEETDDADMVRVVIAALERSPDPTEKILQRESFVADGAVVEGPRLPPKSAPPTDVGLPLVIVDIDGEIDGLLDRLERAEPSSKEAVALRTEVLGLGEQAGPLIMKRFPGSIRVQAKPDSDVIPPLPECGPILDVTLAMGAALVPMIEETSRTADPDTRVWALLVLAELGGDVASRAVGDFLFDEDEIVRGAARACVRKAGHKQSWVQTVRTVVLRVAFDSSESVPRRKAALHVLIDLREGSAVPELSKALSDSDLSDAAYEVLRSLTGRNLDPQPDAWLSWWEKHKAMDRVEWLMEAIGLDDEQSCEAAIEEIHGIVGDDFGYQRGQSRAERDEVVARCRIWWEQDGSHRVTIPPTSN